MSTPVLDVPVDAPAPDEACAAAVTLARAAAAEVAGDSLGEHVGVLSEGERLVTHLFVCSRRAYRGWRWSVTLTRASRSRTPTVAEVGLVAGPEAALAPAWVPWSERLLPGDLGVGDLLVTEADDPRLAAAYAEADDDELAEVSDELYLGRVRVLSDLGRIEAAERWSEGDFGADAPNAKAAPGPCGTCAFLVPLQGGFRGVLGVCANSIATADGRVVTVDHGCGGHSEAVVIIPAPPTGDVLDTDRYDIEHRRSPVLEDPSPEQVASVTGRTDEPLGHS